MGKLTKPAQIGNATFSAGTDERLVIELAQRQYVHKQDLHQKAYDAARETIVDCPLCGNTHTKDYHFKDGFRFSWK